MRKSSVIYLQRALRKLEDGYTKFWVATSTGTRWLRIAALGTSIRVYKLVPFKKKGNGEERSIRIGRSYYPYIPLLDYCIRWRLEAHNFSNFIGKTKDL